MTDDDPGPVWEHLPGVGFTPPASGMVVPAGRVIADIEAGIASSTEGDVPGEMPRSPLPPGAFAALGHAWRLVRTAPLRAGGAVALWLGSWVVAGLTLSDSTQQVAATAAALVVVPIALLPSRSDRPVAPAVLGLLVLAALLLTTNVVLKGTIALVAWPLLAGAPAVAWLGASPLRAVREVGWLAIRRVPSLLIVQWSLAIPFGAAAGLDYGLSDPHRVDDAIRLVLAFGTMVLIAFHVGFGDVAHAEAERRRDRSSVQP